MSSAAPMILELMGEERFPRCLGLIGLGKGIGYTASLPLLSKLYLLHTLLVPGAF